MYNKFTDFADEIKKFVSPKECTNGILQQLLEKVYSNSILLLLLLLLLLLSLLLSSSSSSSSSSSNSSNSNGNGKALSDNISLVYMLCILNLSR